MAKTFNPNRVGGGTVSIVRAADGTYSLKETGFDQISSLNMIDLGAVASVTPPKTIGPVPVDPADELKNQTKAAFLLPKQDKGDDPFTFEKSLKSGADISKGLQDVETVSDRQKTESQLGETGRNPFRNIDTGVGEFEGIKDPTEPVFGRSTVSQEQLQRQDLLPETKVETPQEKLAVTSANVQSGKVEPPGFTNPFKNILGDKFKTEKGPETKFTKPSERAALGFPGDKSEVAQGGMPTDIEKRQQLQLGSLGISADPSKTMAMKQAELASGTITPRVPDAIIQGQPSAPAKKTFIESVNTALKGVGEAAQFMSPIMGVVQALGTPRNESASTTAFNKGKFNIVTSSGPMQGRIVGNDGNYDPANNLFHGMNRSSAFGNLEKAGQKRIDRINKTLSKKNLNSRTREVLEKRRDDFEKELTQYRNDKNDHNIREYNKNKKNTPMSQLNPNEQRNVSETGNAEGNTSSKIVCTMMNQSYGFGSFRNKIWMKFHKDLSPEYQKGYHRLFLPLVRIAKTNKIIKNILEHIAVHSTIDMRQSMRGKKHLLGRVYRKILLPICYWAGKK